MELDFRKLNVKKLFDFSKEEENLIFEVYDNLFEIYDIAVIEIKDSPFHEFNSAEEIPLFTPKIGYFITDENKQNSFYLFIVSKIGTTVKGAYTTTSYDSLQIWGMKKLSSDFEFISVNRKKWADKIAGIFSSFTVNFKDRDFKDFYVLGSDPLKTQSFLNSERKEIIKAFSDEDFKLEIKNDLLSFALPKELSVQNALMVSKFLKEI
ncbi:hypothetical protein QX233_09695 [Chryseobacterium gambrini]|uniref:Uncharacterized protein n=1 Tax=Chryseobacterium gambrini TaxID=373672 RepID=A0AAJ1R303_9FLAO|nr:MULTISPECIES: hypothetical protein [Chryseobacterium]MDN4012733.1 hypothetical protein [Chryseobacterium gambrini]MDN4030383.1 hypothetical protein [Chryseobacterium gambrini]QWA39335.1 hypothetical protein KKI44_03745 [Chryseobacterium sp. ZHDP1]